MAGGFVKQIFGASVIMAVLPCLLYFLGSINFIKPQRAQRNRKERKTNKHFADFAKNLCVPCVKISILIITILVLWLPERSMYNKFKEIFLFGSFTSDKNSNFNQILFDLEQKGNGTKFISKEDLQAEFGGKNIIIISLESFEKALFADKNRELTPNLRKLKEQWNFYSMQPQDGSHWTSGSLYTAFTGLPCFFNGISNQLFQGTKESKTINFCDVLKKCGYEMYHLSNDAEFAGTKDMLQVFGIQNIIDGNFGNKNLRQLPFGGCYDRDIFAQAKKILTEQNAEKPFMLWLSTMQFHSPDGVVDETMIDITGKRATNLETIAAATDYLVADFLQFLKDENFLKNTIVYIMPDHLFMGHKALLETNEPRQLWLMTNAEKKDLTIDTTNFYQIDLAKQFLSGAKIKHNAVFLTDISTGNKDKFIWDNLSEIKSLNMSALKRENIISETFNVFIKDNNIYCVVDNEILFVKNVKSLKNSSIIIQLNGRLEILSNKVIKNSEVNDFCSEISHYFLIYIKNNTINLEAEGEISKKFFAKNKKEIIFTRNEIEQFLDITEALWGKTYQTGEIEKIKIDEQFLPQYFEKIFQDSTKIIFLTIFDDGSTFAGKMSSIMKKTGLKINLDGKFRWSYLAVFSNHKVYFEKASKKTMLAKRLIINDILIFISSFGRNAYIIGDYSHIIFDNKEYSCSNRGWNIVVFDTKTNAVIDAFSVDVCEDESLKIVR